MPRVKVNYRRKQVVYLHSEVSHDGCEIHCLVCGYTGKADRVVSNALACGVLEKCPKCWSMNFERIEESVMEPNWKQDEWKGCYPSSWKGMIVPEAMAHPAKFSSKLIRRIYEHMRAEGWVKPGDRVIDPFGGVALGALDAMRLGLEWLGMELEVKFVDLGNHNISNWDLKYGHTMPNWGSARLIQGDSRKMLENLGRGGAAVSSPPYADSVNNPQKGGIDWEKAGRPDRLRESENRHGVQGIAPVHYGFTEGQLGSMKDNGGSRAAAMISSPPFGESLAREGVDADSRRKFAREQGISNAEHISPIDMERIGKRDQEYGDTPGQLGGMDTGDFDIAISSPPFLQSEGGTGAQGGVIDERLMARHAAGNSAAEGYGAADGQLGNMGEGDFARVAMKSPPYTGEVVRSRGQELEEARMEAKGYVPNGSAGVQMMATYGDTAGNIGNDSGSDFWTAARQIVEQVYLALAPGGHAVWVVKNYVKKKEMVPFSDQWRQLCEAVGFETLHEHRALLVHATSLTLEGKEVRKESKSFFRRLAEKKGSPRIDFETVWCMVKPL